MRVTAQRRGTPKNVLEDDTEDVPDDKVLSRIEGRNFAAPPTIARFLASTAFVRGIRGPVQSGKSSGACQEIMRRAREQVPGEDGIRRTRFVVVRNTYGELKDTTIKTWLDWFPEDLFGKFNRAQGEMKHHIQKGDIDCEVMFRALDKPEDSRKVLSLDITGAWFNEAREIPYEIVEKMTDRVGRFPAKKDGGCTWRGIFLDTNPPDEDHWWYKFEKDPPPGWDFFVQPPGAIEVNGKWVQNPDAENVVNMNEADYYRVRIPGKKPDYIKVYYGNQFGFVQEGKSVFPEYVDTVHGAKMELSFTPGRPVYIGIGIALESAALFGQKLASGQWQWLDEIMPEEGGAVHFADELAAKMKADFPAGTEFRIFGPQPKKFGDETDEALQILRRRKIPVSPTRQADATLRREAVAGVLDRLVRGEPALLVSPRCTLARKAMAGGYGYARIQSSGEPRYHDEPTKNRYWPIAEAAQHMMVGGGEASFVFRAGKPVKLKYPEMGVV